MDLKTRLTVDALAREAAIASWDAHGEFVSADAAWDFMKGVWWDLEDARHDDLPAARPAEFAHDYARYCQLIRECNPMMVCATTRGHTWGEEVKRS